MTTPRDMLAMLEADLSILRAAIYDGAVQRIAESRGGLSGSCFEALGRSSGPADPTASLALRERDLAARHGTELVEAMATAQLGLARAVEVVALYPPVRVADAAERAALERLNGRREPGCENCAQLVVEGGQRRWEPIDARTTEATTVGGVLGVPMLLCGWCRRRVSAWGRLPNLEELARHHRGDRVAWPADVPNPPR